VGILRKEGDLRQKGYILDFPFIPDAKRHAGCLVLVRALLLLLIVPSVATTLAAAAVLRGNVYDYSFDEINDVIVSIDSSPRQQYIVKNGTYFFEVLPGIYNLTAKYYENNRLVYDSEESIIIEDKGTFIFDIILFPSTEEEEMLYYGMDDSLSGLDSLEGEDVLDAGQKDLRNIKYKMFGSALIIIVLICAVAFLLFMLSRQRRTPIGTAKGKPDAGKAEKEAGDASDDYEAMVLKLITQQKRITQKEIRKEVPLSEAKISLIIAGLEAKGTIKKVKKGRGNIIFLNK
jgi:uncharacterized membrane protein